MDLKLLSCFGEHSANAKPSDDETIERLSFSECDRFVASGDHGGNINIYRIKETGKVRSPLNFSLSSKFAAFNRDYDYLRNEVRNPRINCLTFFPKYTLNPLLIASNRMNFYFFFQLF